MVLQTFIWPSDLVLMTVERSVSLTTGFLVSDNPSHPIDVLLSVLSSMQDAPRKPDVIFPLFSDESGNQYLYPSNIPDHSSLCVIKKCIKTRTHHL